MHLFLDAGVLSALQVRVPDLIKELQRLDEAGLACVYCHWHNEYRQADDHSAYLQTRIVFVDDHQCVDVYDLLVDAIDDLKKEVVVYT